MEPPPERLAPQPPGGAPLVDRRSRIHGGRSVDQGWGRGVGIEGKG